jgi:hypothetical protein
MITIKKNRENHTYPVDKVRLGKVAIDPVENV